jgi:solute carrier family 35 protein E3
MLAALVLVAEPLGIQPSQRGADTLLGYHMTPAAAVAIGLSAVLGLLVSLSTFLVIGATSSLSYNVIGHIKTVIILTGGCLLFGEEMPLMRLAGICVAMAGIVWYSVLKLSEVTTAARQLLPSTANGVAQPTAPVPIWRQGLEWNPTTKHL